jgi:hypothetical protein
MLGLGGMIADTRKLLAVQFFAIQVSVYHLDAPLGDHPKPANEGHLKTGQRS